MSLSRTPVTERTPTGGMGRRSRPHRHWLVLVLCVCLLGVSPSLEEGAHGEMYFFTRGDGAARLLVDLLLLPGPADRGILFVGPEVAPAEVLVRNRAPDLEIALRDTPDSVMVPNWFANPMALAMVWF